MAIEPVRRAADPVVSVVIPSVPASDHGPTVERLDEQARAAPYEVILVNDDTVDRSVARNRGIEAAQADVVALTDDDTRPPPDWLSTAVREFRSDPELVCLEGPVYGGCRSFGPRHYVGCNLAVRREAALAIGGFRPEYSEWREDLEFGWRMEAQAVGTCRYHDDCRMCHPRVPRTDMKPALERRLRSEYPDRYDAVLDATLARRVYRWARAAGFTQPLQRVRNAIRRRFRPPCQTERPAG